MKGIKFDVIIAVVVLVLVLIVILFSLMYVFKFDATKLIPI